MYWVETCDGDTVDLAKAEKIVTIELGRYVPGESNTLIENPKGVDYAVFAVLPGVDRGILVNKHKAIEDAKKEIAEYRETLNRLSGAAYQLNIDKAMKTEIPDSVLESP